MLIVGVATLLGRWGGIVLFFVPVLAGGVEVEVEAGGLSVRGR